MLVPITDLVLCWSVMILVQTMWMVPGQEPSHSSFLPPPPLLHFLERIFFPMDIWKILTFGGILSLHWAYTHALFYSPMREVPEESSKPLVIVSCPKLYHQHAGNAGSSFVRPKCTFLNGCLTNMHRYILPTNSHCQLKHLDDAFSLSRSNNFTMLLFRLGCDIVQVQIQRTQQSLLYAMHPFL